MDKLVIDRIEKDLKTRKSQVLKDLNDLKDKKRDDVKFPTYGNKPDENAQEVGDYETNIATQNSLEKTLRDLESALTRIGAGTYGICKYCKKEIGEKRMEARPVASACITCKTKLQKF